jgi:hypothetical protein
MFVTTLLLLASVVVASIGMAAGQADVVAWAAGGSAAYQLSMLGTILVLERSVERILRRRGEPQFWLSPFRVAKLPFALLAMQVLCPLLMWSSGRSRTIVWREVTYQIGGPWDILVLDAQPLKPSSRPAHGNLSA